MHMYVYKLSIKIAIIDIISHRKKSINLSFIHSHYISNLKEDCIHL